MLLDKWIANFNNKENSLKVIGNLEIGPVKKFDIMLDIEFFVIAERRLVIL